MKPVYDAPIRTSGSFLDRVLVGGEPTVVAFEEPGCGPCLSLRCVLDAVAREFANRVRIVRVTDATEGWLAARWHLAFVPTLVFLSGGQEVARIKGDPGRAAVRAHVQFMLDGACPPDPAEGPRHTLRARFGALRSDDAEARQPAGLLFAGR
jgi:thioredoxin 1